MALKALAGGRASDDQQKRALDFIIRRVCRADDLSFVPESDRATAFAEGRRAAGLVIRAIVAMPVENLKPELRGAPAVPARPRKVRKKVNNG